MFLLKFSIGMFILEMYFLSNYLMGRNVMEDIHRLAHELEYLSIFEPDYWFAMNA